ncbi:hypothetical protein [Nocardia farcinica]|uniref:hypothetical protein n=1 Tax=Nocardia farcinica TaxID=37329 RepID=UPI0034DB1BA5
MTADKPRRRSALADTHPAFPAPAEPPAPATAPVRPTVRPTVRSSTNDATSSTAARGRARDQDEALGRVAYRNAALAWASAERKALHRMAELSAQTSAALERGTPPAALGAYLLEACAKHDIDPALLPAAIRAASGLDHDTGTSE